MAKKETKKLSEKKQNVKPEVPLDVQQSIKPPELAAE
jgi:hypothetical protein